MSSIGILCIHWNFPVNAHLRNSDLWSLAVAEKEAADEDRNRGKGYPPDLSKVLLSMTSLLVVLELLDQHGRLEGQTSLFIVGSHSAVSRNGMYMSC